MNRREFNKVLSATLAASVLPNKQAVAAESQDVHNPTRLTPLCLPGRHSRSPCSSTQHSSRWICLAHARSLRC